MSTASAFEPAAVNEAGESGSSNGEVTTTTTNSTLDGQSLQSNSEKKSVPPERQQHYYILLGGETSGDMVSAGGTSVAGSQSAGAVLDAASVPNRVAPAAVLPLVPTGSVVAAPPVVTVKRGAVKPVSAPTLRPAASTTNAATSRSVPVTSILTLQPAPKPPSVVPRTLVTSVPSQSAFLKMIPVTGVTASTTAIMHPSSPVYLSSGQASATSSIGALTRPVSPLKSVAPVKTVTQPGRAIAKMGSTSGSPSGILAAGTTVANASSPPSVIVKKSVIPRPPTASSPAMRVITKPGTSLGFSTRTISSKNVTPADKSHQYKRAVAESLIKLRKIEKDIVQRNQEKDKDKATPFTYGEIFHQAAAGFAKIASLTAHISLETMQPTDQRRWTPEMITKFLGALTTFASSIKEVGDELKTRHEKQVEVNLKRKAETELLKLKKLAVGDPKPENTPTDNQPAVPVSQETAAEPAVNTNLISIVEESAAVDTKDPSTTFPANKSGQLADPPARNSLDDIIKNSISTEPVREPPSLISADTVRYQEESASAGDSASVDTDADKVVDGYCPISSASDHGGSEAVEVSGVEETMQEDVGSHSNSAMTNPTIDSLDTETISTAQNYPA